MRPGDPPRVVDAFFDAALEAVYPYLARRCGADRGVVEDLTQETFVTAVRALQDGRVDHLTVGWMVTVAQSRLIDHVRGEERRTRHLRAIDLPARPADPETAVLGDEVVARLLGRLPPAQRLVVALHHLDGLSTAEIAEHTGRSVRAVESSLARARRSLRLIVDTERGDPRD